MKQNHTSVVKPWRANQPEPIILVARSKPASRTAVIDLALQPVARCGCGQPIEHGAAFCGGCGVQLREALVRIER